MEPTRETQAIKKGHNGKQYLVIGQSNQLKPEIIICDGAVQTGKTYVTIENFMAHVYRFTGRNVNFIMTGHSIGSLERNVLKPMKDVFGIETGLNKYNAFPLFGNNVNCFGTDKADSYRAIQGSTAFGHYANELTLTHVTALNQVIYRCSGEGARFFWEMNPSGPQHYIYRTYIEPAIHNGNNAKIARFNFTLDDNSKANGGTLSETYIARLKESYRGAWFRQYVMGEWAAIEGQIYHLENLQFYDDTRLKPEFFNGAIINGYLDPAAGSQLKTGCYTSIVTAALKDGKIYVLDVVMKKIGVQGMIKTVGEKVQRFHYATFAVEDNFTQAEYVVKPLRESYPFAPIRGLSSREDKISRLVGMQGVIESRVVFPERFRFERNSDGWLLLNQLCNVTKEHKIKPEDPESFLDGPDALEGVIRTFRNVRAGETTGFVGSIDHNEKRDW